jgi:diguanylate cyclase (GGDEF)-like protein/PAS domain S-box-containing protein
MPRGDRDTLYKGEAMLWAALEHSSDGIFLVDVKLVDTTSSQETEFCFVAANSTCIRMWAIAIPQIAGLAPHECLPVETANGLHAHLIYCLEQRQPVRYEEFFKLEADSFTRLTTLLPVIEVDGRPSQIIGVCRDATQLKQTEEALRDGEELYWQMFEKNRSIELLVDSESGVIVEANPASSKFYGYQQEELTTKKITDLVTISQIQMAEEIARAVSEKSTCYSCCHRLASGEVRDVEVNSILIEEGRRLLHITIQDVTERKQAEEALRESEERLRVIAEATPVPVLISRKSDGLVLYANAHLGSTFGLATEEVIGLKTLDFYYNPADRQVLLDTLKQDGYLRNYELQVKKVDGTPFWVAVSIRFLKFNGEPAMFSAFYDITERKWAEEALRESEKRYQNLYDRAPDIYFSVTADGTIKSVNQFGAEYLGYHKEELTGRPIWHLIYEEDQGWLQKQITEVFSETLLKDISELEFRKVRRDGSILWVHERIQLILDEASTPIELRVICRDITERRRAEEAHRQAEAKYRSIFENAVEGIFQTTTEGQYLTANPMLAHICGYNSPEELMASLTDIERQLYVDPNRRSEFRRLVQEQGAIWGFASQVYRKDGDTIWISENARAIYDASGQLTGYEGTVEDITERKRAEAELHKRDSLLQGVAEATNHLLTHTDYSTAIAKALATLGTAAGVDRVYIYENHPHFVTGEPAMSMRFEWTRESVEPSIHKSHWQNQLYRAFGMSRWYDALSVGNSISGITRELPAVEQEILDRDGILSILIVPILVNDQFWGYIGFDDCHSERRWSKSEESILLAMAASISAAFQRQQTEQKIWHQALHDLLTGLPNRTQFNKQLVLSLESAQQNEDMLAVMFLDLDRFKTINDTLGHTVGDQLLKHVAKRLKGCLRSGDCIARWGGDEFTLLLPRISCTEDAAKVAQRTLEASKPAFDLEGHTLYISTSIGIALYPRDGKDVQTLLKNADAALYRAKEQGRNNYQFYTPAINPQASKLLALENSLHQVLERGELVVYYQPQVNTKTWEITQMEALLRWQHPELGLILPSTFIPLAEETGLIVPICEWVLRTACAQNKIWQEAVPLLHLSINLSARQFQQPNLDKIIAQVLQEIRVEPRFLELEITETTAMQDVDFTSAMLHSLHQMGVHLAIDDFGTGYSSLSYLKQFPFNTIKLDQSFIQDLTTNPKDAAIATAMIALGRGLNLRVIAEGVTTKEQLDCLRSLQCEEMQGYLFSPPLSAEAATNLLQAYQLHKEKVFAALDEKFQAQPA